MNIIFFHLGDSPASEFCVPQFRNTYIFTGRLNRKKTTTTNTCFCIRHLPNSGSTGTHFTSKSHYDWQAVGQSCGALRRRYASLWRQKSPPLSVVLYIICICIYTRFVLDCVHIFSTYNYSIYNSLYNIHTAYSWWCRISLSFNCTASLVAGTVKISPQCTYIHRYSCSARSTHTVTVS